MDKRSFYFIVAELPQKQQKKTCFPQNQLELFRATDQPKQWAFTSGSLNANTKYFTKRAEEYVTEKLYELLTATTVNR